MDILESVRARKSIRGYKQDPVPREIIREILDVSTRAPSALNTQPWEFTVVTGEALDGICKGNVEKLLAGATSLHRAAYPGVYKKRQVELAKEIFKLMAIEREDSIKRAAWAQRGFRFFDAPAAIIISLDKEIEGTMALFDLGAITQTICLVAMKHGLGTCIEVQGVMFPEVIRKHTGIPESRQIIIGIALGYPDWSFPANQLHTQREPIENLVAWHGFKTK